MSDKAQFVAWLKAEVQARGWTYAEFARRAGLSAPTVSRVVAGDNGPGDEFIAGAARAFGVPTESVMRLVGKLPDLGEVLPEAREWSYRLKQLAPDRRAAAMRAIENILLLAEPGLAAPAAPRRRSRPARSAGAASAKSSAA